MYNLALVSSYHLFGMKVIIVVYRASIMVYHQDTCSLGGKIAGKDSIIDGLFYQEFK
jgi:hypothetical protein